MLNVSDLYRSIKFYDLFLPHLGFEMGHFEEDERGGAKQYKCSNFSLWLKFERFDFHHNFNRSIGLDHLAFRTMQKEKVADLYNLLSRNNTLITREPRPYPQYSEYYYAFYFRDPDQLPLEIMFDTPG